MGSDGLDVGFYRERTLPEREVFEVSIDVLVLGDVCGVIGVLKGVVSVRVLTSIHVRCGRRMTRLASNGQHDLRPPRSLPVWM